MAVGFMDQCSNAAISTIAYCSSLAGGPYAVYAGHEVARGLALMSLKPEDRTDDVSDLTEKQLGTLADWISKFEAKYPVVGQIAATKQLTLKELERFKGAQPGEPIYLAVRGTVFDVTADCNDDISDCSIAEKDALRDWEGRFYSKYKIVGKIVSSKS
ncbi:hypothetical protein H632_c504p0 [Helicosporidium sp. ATCC 50920]|nr:hypothetical protein H632_c504p0 [Helicosporidium sp. ATCC 50920]|eukprot:KDD75774.1 hypothetical protein H632_c504p0 [Helicosporidium sp. ATCC 50920]